MCEWRPTVPIWLQAGGWGLLAGSALLVGAAIAYFASLPQRVIAGVMAIGAGVLISAVAFDLMDEAFREGGFDTTSIGFLAGAAIYSAANAYLSHRGAKHRKRSGSNPDESPSPDGGLAIAVGALIDGIPESVVIGASLLAARARALSPYWRFSCRTFPKASPVRPA
jgi:ZIP family zinc transporter